MTQQPSRTLQLLAQLEAHLENLEAHQAEVTQWQIAAQRRQRQLNRLESQMYRTTMHFVVERDGLKQERDAAYAMILQLVTVLRPFLDEENLDRDELRLVRDAAIQLLKRSRFLDTMNLDTTMTDDPS